MFSIDQIHGNLFPDKTLCLTFDDGPGESIENIPGSKTVKLAQYLKEQDISATFFMVGKYICKYPAIPSVVSKLGHIVGNHTFCHSRGLKELLQDDWDIVEEIEMTDYLIKELNPDCNIYFRAPWGNWSEKVANYLNESIKNGLNHIGPFHWDIGGNDWYYWKNGWGAAECANYYLDEVMKVNHGIILMHDSTADLTKAKGDNLTYEAIKILIPTLKELGYSFVNLNEIIR